MTDDDRNFQWVMISEARVEATIETIPAPRRIALVRVTHWIIVLSVVGLLVSG